MIYLYCYLAISYALIFIELRYLKRGGEVEDNGAAWIFILSPITALIFVIGQALDQIADLDLYTEKLGRFIKGTKTQGTNR
jgi:hypothetical protein